MTGTGMNIITRNNVQSYNTAISSINKHQKENLSKLESALVVANSNNNKLQDSLDKVNRNIKQLKQQAFINQCIISNWNSEAPYTFPTELLV